MKNLLLVFGVALVVLGVQDAIRVSVDPKQTSIFSFLNLDQPFYVVIGIALALAGVFLASKASKM
jgi:H+/Cl- antiporter ClcA